MTAQRPGLGGAPAPAPPADAVQLRPMSVRHLGGVLRLERATSSQPWTRETFIRELEDPATRRYVVACSSAPRRFTPAAVIGFAGVQRRPDAAHVTTIAVAPEHRRQGVGARLLEWLLDAAVALGCRAATLEVRASNAEARRLYARAGFVEAGARPDYYRQPTEDAVIMWQTLTARGDAPQRRAEEEGG